RGDLAPLVLAAVGGALEDAPADARLKHDVAGGGARDGVARRPPGGEPLGPGGERVVDRAVKLDTELQGLGQRRSSRAWRGTVLLAKSAKREAASPQIEVR